MRFQKGIGYQGPRWPRGPGRGDPPYRMSRAAYQARRNNLRCITKPRRTYEETRRIELEVALWTHRSKGESLRALAKRLHLKSYAHCWRVARNYRNGLIPMLPEDEQGLLALRESILNPRPSAHTLRAGNTVQPGEPGIPGHTRDCSCAGCGIERIVPTSPEHSEQITVAADQSSAWDGYELMTDGTMRPKATSHVKFVTSDPNEGRRTFSSISPWFRPTPKLDFWDD